MITDLLNKKVITEVFTEEEKKQLEGKSLEELKDMKLVTLVEVEESAEENLAEPAVDDNEKASTEPVVEDDEDLPVVDEEE